MKNWVKIVIVILLVYLHVGGLLFDVPRRDILNETIRAVYFHATLWFGMVALFIGSLYYAIRYLKEPLSSYDIRSSEFAHVGIAFGLIALCTGIIWGRFTWGSFWHGDVKQNGAAITLLIYFAYFVLRGSLENEEQRARLSAVYNIFAFAAMIPLIFIIPRMTNSLHPGSDGNPAFSSYDMDSRMRMVFYPAGVAWILVGLWISSLRVRLKEIQEKINQMDYE